MIQQVLSYLMVFFFMPVYALSSVEEPAAVHGMILFGTYRMYASHLPMQRAPHDTQVILEVALDAKSVSALVKEQHKHPHDETYTLKPEPFVLSEMIAHPTAFDAALYRGHFERGGHLIVAHATVHVVRVVYARSFQDPLPSFPPHNATSYLLFGDEAEQFAAHFIQSQPSFAHVMKIDLPKQNAGFFEYAMINAMEDTVPDVAGNYVEAQVQDSQGNLRALGFYWQKQIYLEFSDLK